MIIEWQRQVFWEKFYKINFSIAALISTLIFYYATQQILVQLMACP